MLLYLATFVASIAGSWFEWFLRRGEELTIRIQTGLCKHGRGRRRKLSGASVNVSPQFQGDVQRDVFKNKTQAWFFPQNNLLRRAKAILLSMSQCRNFHDGSPQSCHGIIISLQNYVCFQMDCKNSTSIFTQKSGISVWYYKSRHICNEEPHSRHYISFITVCQFPFRELPLTHGTMSW